jgi:hypothetical protein
VILQRFGHQITACAAVVGYGLAAVGSPFLHDHRHCHDEHGCCIHPDDGGCGHSHHHGHCHSTAGEPHQHPPAPLYDDDCAACQFLAQKPLMAAPVRIVESGELIAVPAPEVVVLLAAEPPEVPEARGPPVLA